MIFNRAHLRRAFRIVVEPDFKVERAGESELGGFPSKAGEFGFLKLVVFFDVVVVVLIFVMSCFCDNFVFESESSPSSVLVIFRLLSMRVQTQCVVVAFVLFSSSENPFDVLHPDPIRLPSVLPQCWCICVLSGMDGRISNLFPGKIELSQKRCCKQLLLLWVIW